jgi:dehydrogenase/reductase SDR family protein 13
MRAMPFDIANKVAVITGANTGIGRVTARALATAGATVIFLCRSEEKTRPVMAEIEKETGNAKLEFLPCDLTSLSSVAAAADGIMASGRPISLLVNNAGVAGVRGITADGFELAFGTNHLAHFLLTERLRPAIEGADAARIVNVASTAHYNAKGIDFAALRQSTPTVVGMAEYAVSKLANVLHAAELARRLPPHVKAYSLHPGVVGTDIWERRLGKTIGKLLGAFMLSVEDGAKTTIHCCLSDGLDDKNGRYFDASAEKTPSRPARDEALAAALWRFSEEALAPYSI